jgi:enoyl-CoA hydratase/carnithine racemase
VSDREQEIIFEKRGAIGLVTLNRPHVLNAFNLNMRDLLWSTLEAIRDDEDVRVAVFVGAGDRAFSAGADISEFGTAPSYVEARRARRERDLWGLMLGLDKPLIAAVHGFAYGAGCELALLCDFRIASDDARFALPEVSLGYIPSAGGTQTLTRTIKSGIAREIVYSGRPVDAARALDLGLVQRVVSRDKLESEALSVAEYLAALTPHVVRNAKQSMRQGAGLPLEAALAVERTLAARSGRSG